MVKTDVEGHDLVILRFQIFSQKIMQIYSGLGLLPFVQGPGALVSTQSSLGGMVEELHIGG